MSFAMRMLYRRALLSGIDVFSLAFSEWELDEYWEYLGNLDRELGETDECLGVVR